MYLKNCWVGCIFFVSGEITGKYIEDLLYWSWVSWYNVRCRTCSAGNYPRIKLTVFATFNWIFEFEFVRRMHALFHYGILSDNWTRSLLWRVHPREVRPSLNGTKGFFRSRREFDVAHQWWAACVSIENKSRIRKRRNRQIYTQYRGSSGEHGVVERYWRREYRTYFRTRIYAPRARTFHSLSDAK